MSGLSRTIGFVPRSASAKGRLLRMRLSCAGTRSASIERIPIEGRIKSLTADRGVYQKRGKKVLGRVVGKRGNIVLVYSGTFDVPLLAAHSRSGVALSLLGQHRVVEAIAEAQGAGKQAPDSAEINAIL